MRNLCSSVTLDIRFEIGRTVRITASQHSAAQPLRDHQLADSDLRMPRTTNAFAPFRDHCRAMS
jgi:hypothetical protein